MDYSLFLSKLHNFKWSTINLIIDMINNEMIEKVKAICTAMQDLCWSNDLLFNLLAGELAVTVQRERTGQSNQVDKAFTADQVTFA